MVTVPPEPVDPPLAVVPPLPVDPALPVEPPVSVARRTHSLMLVAQTRPLSQPPLDVQAQSSPPGEQAPSADSDLVPQAPNTTTTLAKSSANVFE